MHQTWLAANEPGLAVVLEQEAGSAHITGNLEISLGAGIPREFQLQMIYPRSSDGALNPFRPPDTYEIGGRFPHGEADRHIEYDGRFCLWHPLTEPQDFDRPDGLALHLDRVRQFLRLQLRYENRQRRGLEPYWAGPEWDHGTDGHRQWVREHVAAVPPEAFGWLFSIAFQIYDGRPGSVPTRRCACGSGQNWRRCHGEWVRRLVRAMKTYPHPVHDELLRLLKDEDEASTTRAAEHDT